jgi:hypothetical protein
MITNVPIERIFKLIGKGATRTVQRQKALFTLGVSFDEHITRYRGGTIPDYSICVLHFKKDKRTHCAVWFDGKFYDPFYGILEKYEEGIRVTSYLKTYGRKDDRTK